MPPLWPNLVGGIVASGRIWLCTSGHTYLSPTPQRTDAQTAFAVVAQRRSSAALRSLEAPRHATVMAWM
ncbi:MAG: hypothetical protein JWM72_4245 [Actinomycetia bacterium]|nr:hypothetical protein [Actinomycetes bacterium]